MYSHNLCLLISERLKLRNVDGCEEMWGQEANMIINIRVYVLRDH